MAFEPKYDVIKNDYKKKIGAYQVVVEARLRPDGGVGISKVLSITCDTRISNSEALSGEARTGGTVVFKVLFSDGEGKLHCLEDTAEFSEKISDACITPVSRLNFSAAVLDTDTVNVTQSEIKLAAVVEVCAEIFASDSAGYLTGGGGEIYTQVEKIEHSSLITNLSDEFLVSDEAEPKEAVAKILITEAAAFLTDVKPALDSILLSGRIIGAVTYETDDAQIKTYNIAQEFSQEVPALGTRDEHKVCASVKVKKFVVRYEPLDEAGEKGIFKTDCAIEVSGAVFNDITAEAVTDAFSIDSEIQIAGESFTVNKYCETLRREEKIEGTAALDAGMPNIDNILTISASRVNIANAYADAGKIVLEGVVATSVIYYNNEFETRNSVTVELPYSVAVPAQNITGAHTVIARATAVSLNAKPKRGAEVDITAYVMFETEIYSGSLCYVIKEINIGAARDSGLAAIAIHIAKEGQTLWEVAKALTTTPEIIMTQNPNLKLPFAGGERVMVYRSIRAKF